MKSIQGRLCTLEKKLNVGKEPESIEDLFAAMEQGDYGEISMMSIVTSIIRSGGVDHLKGRLPDDLVSWLGHCYGKITSDLDE